MIIIGLPFLWLLLCLFALYCLFRLGVAFLRLIGYLAYLIVTGIFRLAPSLVIIVCTVGLMIIFTHYRF